MNELSKCCKSLLFSFHTATHWEAWQVQINEIEIGKEDCETSYAQKRVMQVQQEANGDLEEQKEAGKEAEEKAVAS